MERRKYFLGLDIGSVSLAIVLLDKDFTVIHSSYSFHNGRLTETLRKELQFEIQERKGPRSNMNY